MKSTYSRISTFGVLISSLLVSDMALAELEEIIVTARFRQESVQDIGGSISALSNETIRKEGIADFEDIARRTVGLNLYDRGPNQNEVSIRGISNNSALFFADNGQTGPLVSQYMDDISFASSLGAQRDFNYFDFERVEVLRGPQPTVFGEGAVGGTIRYFTRNPDLSGEKINDSVLQTGLSFTEDGGTNVSVSAATSLVLVPDVFGIRGVINYRNDDGYINNPVTGDNDINDFESVGGRIVALYQPSEKLTMRFSASISDDEGGAVNLVDAPSPTNSPEDLTLNAPVNGSVDDEFELYSGKIEYDFGAITATSITGYFERERDVRQFNNATFTVFCPFIAGAGSSCSPESTSFSKDESFSQEFRIVSNFEGRLNFIAGGYYQDSELDITIGADAPEFANPLFTNPVTTNAFLSVTNFETEQYSGFLEATFSATDRIRLIGGVRYVNEDITANTLIATNLDPFTPLFAGLPILPMPTADSLIVTTALGFPLTETFTLDTWLPKGSIEFDVTDDAMVYALAAKGARNGNLNPPNSVGFATGFEPVRFAELRTYDEDSAVSYEIGLKANWMDNTLVTNVAIYRTDYSDPLVMVAVPFVLMENGPDIEITGVEAETFWQINDIFLAYANVAYTDAEFEGDTLLIPRAAALGFTSDVEEGDVPANTPEWTFSLGGDIRYPLAYRNLTLIGHVGYQYIDSTFATPQNFPSVNVESQGFLNLRLGVEADNWSLTGYAMNVTNELEYQHKEYSAGPFVNADGELDNLPNAASINRPRTVGIEFNLNY